MSKSGNDRIPKQHASNVRIFEQIFEQEVDKNSKIEQSTQLRKIRDGMSKMLKEIEDNRNEIHDMKTVIFGTKYRLKSE